MSLRVYNTLTREKEIFEPLHPGKVGIYLCGPTVYKPPHIGHMVGPVIFDVIKRFLVFKGYQVKWVVNITDVEDKLIEAAAKSGKTVAELAERYTGEYFDCLKRLGIDTIDQFPKASEHIGEIIRLCETLIEKGHAYAAQGNVYFDVSKDPAYGKLSGRKVEEQEAGLRNVEAAGKRNPADFALWKAAKPGEPAWDSPWGQGRPGWHIECSAMSMKYLGETFDMHGGGMDLMFPHHENELAQSQCATGKTFARFWMHNGLTRIRTKLPSGKWADEKMSGSIGNVVPAAQLLDEHGPELLRYMLISTHYRRPIEFTHEVMANAKKGLSVFHRLLERVERLGGQVGEVSDMDAAVNKLSGGEYAEFGGRVGGYRSKFLEMMEDDFNTAGAIAVLHELAGEINAFIERTGLEKQPSPSALEAVSLAAGLFRQLGLLLGLFRASAAGPAKQSDLVEKLMTLLIDLRREARQAKNFTLADTIRNKLSEIGVTLEDRPGGTIWRED